MGEELGELEGGETIIRIYHMREVSISNKGKNETKKKLTQRSLSILNHNIRLRGFQLQC